MHYYVNPLLKPGSDRHRVCRRHDDLAGDRLVATVMAFWVAVVDLVIAQL